MRKTLEAIVDVRALLPLSNTDERIQSFRILNEDQKTVLRVQLEDVLATNDGGNAKLTKSVRLVPVRGYVKELQEFKQFLSSLDVVPVQEDSLSAALVTPDKSPGDYSSKLRIALDPQEESQIATKKILSHLLRTIKQNEHGIKSDIDTEFLHDFRVAVRRTRSALSLIKGVFPKEMTKRFRRDFARIGKRTYRIRDLDVYLLKRDEYMRLLPENLQPGLEPVFDRLRKERQTEHQDLIDVLESEEYRKSLLSYENFLLSDNVQGQIPKNAERSILRLAQKFIRKAYREVILNGRAIDSNSPDSELHALRIKCKRLRYLLEFFSSLFPKNEISILVKQLKNLQDNLGDFNDFYVQQGSLVKLLETSRFGKDTRQVAAAVGGLVAILFQMQRQTRDNFADRFSEFNAEENNRLCQQLFAVKMI